MYEDRDIDYDGRPLTVILRPARRRLKNCSAIKHSRLLSSLGSTDKPAILLYIAERPGTVAAKEHLLDAMP